MNADLTWRSSPATNRPRFWPRWASAPSKPCARRMRLRCRHLLARYPAHAQAPAWLVDAYHPGEYGGTGLSADWSTAAGLARIAPLLLAGGLRAENVAAAVKQVRPWGVDVASGVEIGSRAKGCIENG